MSRRRRKRVIVLGMDGLCWPVIDTLIGQGKLPSFRQAMTDGDQRSMTSTIPPLTPAAWSTLFSGLAPEQHGIFDFTARERDSYSFRLCTSHDRQATMLWERASAGGLQVAAVNVPMTYPPVDINGLMVSGMDAPDLDGAVSSDAQLAAVLAAAPGYQIDAMSHCFDDPECFRDQLWRMHRARHRLALDRLDSHDWDLFICVYVLADRVQHVAWSEPPSAEMTAAYERLDAVLGDYLERLEEGDQVLLCSDHGFQTLRAEICINRILADAGLLVLDRKRSRRLVDQYRRRWTLLRQAGDQWPDDPWQLPPRALWFDAIDWSRTRCAAYGLIGNLMINLKGRDREGIVNPDNASRLLQEVEAAVAEKLTMESEVVQVMAHRIAWDHQRPSPTSPPDAVIEIDRFKICTWGGRELFAPAVLRPNAELHTGTHSLDGVFLSIGSSRAGSERGSCSATDLTPTVLDLLGLPGNDLAGRSLVPD
jgi:predicted AlkP superfamily phosphohydrolase/phosphomutase